MRQVTGQHLPTSLGSAIQPERGGHATDLAAGVVARGKRLMHGGAELSGAGGADVRRLQLVRWHRHAPDVGEPVAHRADLEVVQLGEAQLDQLRRAPRRGVAPRLDLLEAVQHGGHDRRVVADLADGRPRHWKLKLLGLDDGRGLGMCESPAHDLGEMIMIVVRRCALRAPGAISPDLIRARLLAGRCDIEGVLGSGEADVDDPPPLADG